MTHSNAVVIQM